MQNIFAGFCFLAGAAAGAAAVWLWMRALGERLRDREQEKAALAAALDSKTAEAAGLAVARADLEARLSAAQEALRDKDSIAAALERKTTEAAELAAVRADLEARLEEVRKAAAEKPAIQAALEQKTTEAAQLAAVQADLEARLNAAQEALQEKSAIAAALERKTTEAAELAAVRADLEARLQGTEQSAKEKLALLDEARQKLADAFNALSADALNRNNQAFLDLARTALEKEQQAARGNLTQLVQPVRESLAKFETRIGEIETARVDAYAGLKQQVESLLTTQTQLRQETGRLVTALRTPSVRGHWGEMQLRRVVEMAGMLDHCDFTTQQSVTGEEGRLRPDLIVQLPGGKTVIVDAKAPLEAYLKAIEAEDDASRKGLFANHAAQVRTHMTNLARKSYWEQFETAPEFVVLFLPGECFFSAALEQDPSLIEIGVEQRIILATPTTLIALLRAVAYGWRQENLARNAAEISRLGKDLYKRLADMGQHWVKLGKNLDRAVDCYNSAVGSLETRVLPAARKFEELEASGHGVEIEELAPLDKTARELQAPEMERARAAAGAE